MVGDSFLPQLTGSPLVHLGPLWLLRGLTSRATRSVNIDSVQCTLSRYQVQELAE